MDWTGPEISKQPDKRTEHNEHRTKARINAVLGCLFVGLVLTLRIAFGLALCIARFAFRNRLDLIGIAAGNA